MPVINANSAADLDGHRLRIVAEQGCAKGES